MRKLATHNVVTQDIADYIESEKLLFLLVFFLFNIL